MVFWWSFDSTDLVGIICSNSLHILFLNSTLVHSISKQVWIIYRGISWSAGKLSEFSTTRLFFSKNCLFIYFISFFKLCTVNSSFSSSYLVLLCLNRMLTKSTTSPRVKQSSARCFLSLSISTTMSLKHSKYFCFSSCLIATCSSIKSLVTKGYLCTMGHSRWATVLFVKSRSWFLTIASSYADINRE